MKDLRIYFKIKSLVFCCLLASVQTMAQMEPAKKITMDFDTTVKFNVSVATLWNTLKEPATWASFSNGYIKSIDVTGALPNQTRMLHFADGTERKDIVAQYQPEYRFIVFKIADPLSPAIKDNVFGFTSATEGKGLSSLHMMIKIEGDEKEKSVLLQALKKEITGYIAGLTKLFSSGL